MIRWREGKAGFVGGSKYKIRGFFSYSYAITTADVTQTAGNSDVSLSGLLDSDIGLSGGLDNDINLSGLLDSDINLSGGL